MVDPIQFRRRPEPQSEQLRAVVLAQCLDVTLQKDDRIRRYWIRPGRAADEWFCQVWFSEQTQHRGDVTSDLHRLQQLKAEYFREIDELERDGWVIVDGADPRPRTKL